MNTRSLLSITLAFIALFMFASCKKSNEIGRYIPNDAIFIVHLNGESLNSKLPWNEVKANQLFQEIYSDTAMDAVVKAALDNPENTGIDIKNDITLFVKKDSIGGYIAIQGKIKDAEKFKAFYTTATKATFVPGKEGVSNLSNEKMIATWNKDRFVIVFDVPQMNQMDQMNKMPPLSGLDSTSGQPDMSAMTFVKRDLNSVSDLVFNLSEKSSLANDDKFTELVKNKGDMHFWVNSGAIMAQSPALSGGMGMINLSKMYEGLLFTGTATFTDGKIEGTAKSYVGKELTDIFKKYEGSDINKDMLKRIPSKNVAALFAMNFKPEGIKEFIKVAGLEGMANMGAGMLGFTIDDFVKANKGDIMFSVTDMSKDSLGKSDGTFLFSTAIGDKAAFGKLIDAGKKAGATDDISFNSNDKYFAIGNKKAAIDAYFKDGTDNTPSFIDKITGSPYGFYIDLQYIMSSTAPPVTDSLGTAIYTASMQMWENVISKGGEFKDGGIVQSFEINLMDKKVNSLKQLNNYMGILGAIQKKKKEQTPPADMFNEIAPADSIIAVPAF